MKRFLRLWKHARKTACSSTRPTLSNQMEAINVDTPPSLQAVIFDCDGILVDTEPLHYKAFQAVLKPFGLVYDYDHYLKHYIGFDDRDAFRESFREGGRPLDGVTLERLIEAKDHELRKVIASGISTFPGVISLVRELQSQEVPLAVASGALHREVEDFIEALGLRDAFPIIIAADDVERSKPDPETYIKAFEALKARPGLDRIEPRRCAAIEDTPAGIQAAASAGLMVVAVTNSFPAPQLNKADRVVASLEEVSRSGLDEWIRQRKDTEA